MHLTAQAQSGSSRAVPPFAVLIAVALLIASATAPAQEPDTRKASTDISDEAGEVGRARRVGGVITEEERESGDTAPEGAFSAYRLPDPEQDAQMQALLYRLNYDPQDSAARKELRDLMTQVAGQARIHIKSNEIEQAKVLLDVVESVDPDNPVLAAARGDIEKWDEIERQLNAARTAMAQGRVDQPESNSAWTYYRRALEQDPGNDEARQGLIAVQQDMITRAMAFARQMDFDSAELLLEDASHVRESQEMVDEAREEISEYRRHSSAELESLAIAAMDAGDFKRAELILIDLIAQGSAFTRVTQLRQRLDEARVYGGFKPGQIITDPLRKHPVSSPETVVVMAGSFMMGSGASEQGRRENEHPQHRVTFRRGFAIGRREISVGEFGQFVELTGYQTTAERMGYSTIYDHRSGRLTQRDGVNWRMDYEGSKADGGQPVVHVSFTDAQAYVGWLARSTGKKYRLPTEAEFEYALRGGKASRYWWGNGSPSEVVENITGEGDTSRSHRRWSVFFENYTDGFWGPAPAGSFKTNPFGIHDIGGNVGEWVWDCWHETYIRAPADGSAWINPGCGHRVIRGGYWASSPDQTRAAYRIKAKPDDHGARIGFRIARDL
jgi:formylglycine-generating enzyme required for sulfatase activity